MASVSFYFAAFCPLFAQWHALAVVGPFLKLKATAPKIIVFFMTFTKGFGE